VRASEVFTGDGFKKNLVNRNRDRVEELRTRRVRGLLVLLLCKGGPHEEKGVEYRWALKMRSQCAPNNGEGYPLNHRIKSGNSSIGQIKLKDNIKQEGKRTEKRNGAKADHIYITK